jgi:hypothetical protein
MKIDCGIFRQESYKEITGSYEIFLAAAKINYLGLKSPVIAAFWGLIASFLSPNRLISCSIPPALARW